MEIEAIKQMIESGLPGCSAHITGDGTHFEAIVVGEAFRGKSLLEKHRLVYSTLGASMGGAIHALSIRAYSPDEWEQQGGRTPG